jgi:hypothetical protein
MFVTYVQIDKNMKDLGMRPMRVNNDSNLTIVIIVLGIRTRENKLLINI